MTSIAIVLEVSKIGLSGLKPKRLSGNSNGVTPTNELQDSILLYKL